MINLERLTKSLLIISLIWIIIDGIFRKWLLPSFSTPLFAVKYVLFTLTYIFHFFKTNFRLPALNKGYQLFIIILVIWCLLSLLNPIYKPGWLINITGLINYLFFIPLTFIIPHYFTSLTFFEKTIRFIAYISIPIYIIGIIQYYLPVDHILNYLPNEEQKFNKVAEFTRSNSIFSFVKIYNVYLTFTTTLFFGYIFYLYRKNKSGLLYIIVLLFGILNQFMTGSRLPLALMFVSFIIISAYIFLNISSLRKTIVVSSIVGIITLLVAFNFSTTFNTAINSFITRVEFTEHVAKQGVEGYSTRDRIIDRVTIFKFSEEAGFMGFGIGTAYQGTGFYLNKKRPDIKFEEEGERIVLELGIIGGIILILLRLSLFQFSLFSLLKSKLINISILKLIFLLLIIPPILFLNNTTFNYIDGFFYWLCFSFILALNKIELNLLNNP